jgi:hypothetical protein
MAIVKLQPDAAPPVTTTTPAAIPEPDKSIFTSIVPEAKIAQLLKYVEGYNWTIHYYGQILNENNTIENFDPSAPNLTQPYYEVKNLILQVSSPLTSNYDPNTGVTTITGSAITPYTLKPNAGDIFIAQVDTGEDAIFLINSVSRKTYRKDTLYEINYSLYGYISANPTFLPTLTARVQQTYYFNKDSNYYNRDLLITPTVKEAIDRLNTFLAESQDFYFSTFTQREYHSLLIPGTEYAVYDPILLNFISKIIDVSSLDNINIFRHNYMENKYIEQRSIFDVLLLRNKNIIPTIHKQYVFVSTNTLPNRARLGTIAFTGPAYVIYPKVPNIKTDITQLSLGPTVIENPYNVKNANNYFLPTITIQTESNNNLFTKPLLHELFINDFYVVSDRFYAYLNDNSVYTDISYLELLIARYVKQEAISKKDLVIASQEYMNWSPLHQMYLLPVLWLMIKANL